MNSQGDAINPNNNTTSDNNDDDDDEDAQLTDPYRKNFVRTRSGFRSAWEYEDQDSSAGARSKRQRDSWLDPEAWNPIKWLGLTEVEKDGDGATEPGQKKDEKKQSEEKAGADAPTRTDDEYPLRTESPQNTPDEPEPEPEPAKADTAKPTVTKASRVPRQFSLSSMKPAIKTAPTWNRIKALLPQVVGSSNEQTSPTVERKKQDVDVVYELTYAGLAPLVLRMWFERDERDERRVPILMHHLKVRVGDSIHPLSSSKAVFRIECEYANGAARWVLYRQLRDFRKLNRHYRVANFYTMSDVKLPDFPLSSINKMHFYRMKREKGSIVARAEFAKMQRQALENYLVGLIRAVMFEASSNRLTRFLEISALSIALAHSGGVQYKAGILKVEPNGAKKEYGRKGTSWREKRKGRWAAVRESYLVVMKEAGELDIYDVFLLDSEFHVERPTRALRQGLRAIHLEDKDDEGKKDGLTVPGRRLAKSSHRHGDHLHPGHKSGEDEGDTQEHTDREEEGRHRKSRTEPNQSYQPGDSTEHDHADAHHRHATDINGPESPKSRHHRPHARRSSVSTARSTILGRLRSIRSGREGSRRRSSSSDSVTTHDSDSSVESDMAEPAYNDPSTHVNIMTNKHSQGDADDGPRDKGKEKDLSHHTFFIENSQMRLKLVARTERQTDQWVSALERMKSSSYWYGKNRFDSFAPIRLNVAVQWLVDGRDYYWNLARAIQLAKKVIYIHGWWLSPELQLRRPGKENYRLDRLLKRKAQEGVMIYVVLYKEVSNRTTPTDSNHAKQVLSHLHPNIMVQRSPSHFATGTFYWAHHEKMCVIDETIAFMGGLDACFGRWDTPQHVLIDNGEPEGAEGSQVWTGKDYSNPRIMDFHNLDKPEQDMYDRTKVARMPWHDISLQVVGQPARDICRHFVQRWNYLLRLKNHSRQMPFLLPAPEFKPGELTSQGLTGTCEMQICRSAGPWSMGTLNKVEHSIQNAYLKAIQMSDHFVYIENQFFITSTVVGDIEIENKIGDALVHRIIRAHREGTKWKACILIPLLPGFTFPVDHDSASAIRIILECQNRSISRGPHSIFSRLRKEGIDPDDYISFFSLRGWGKLPGDVLTTEQVYIHAKIMVVDDRLAIIGSANINERSQRGDRDSELAAVIRDTDMIEGTMGGEPYKVGRFAHTLRVRLMREHLGIDVDALYEEDIEVEQPESTDPPPNPENVERWDPDQEQEDISPQHPKLEKEKFKPIPGEASAAGRLLQTAQANLHQVFMGVDAATAYARGEAAQEVGIAPGKDHGIEGDEALEEERQTYGLDGQKEYGFASSKVATLEEKTVAEKRPKETSGDKPLLEALEKGEVPPSPLGQGTTPGRTKEGEQYGAPADAMPNDNEPPHARSPSREDATDQERGAARARTLLRKHLGVKLGTRNWTLPTPAPVIDPHGFDDPICDEFWKDVWISAAVHNTEIYRQVFHAVPDDLVTTWKQYKEFVSHHERLQKPVKDPAPEKTPMEKSDRPPVGRVPSEGGNEEVGVQVDDTDAQNAAKAQLGRNHDQNIRDNRSPDTGESSKAPSTFNSDPRKSVEGLNQQTNGSGGPQRSDTLGRSDAKKKPADPNDGFEPWERELMEEMLNDVKGHLVLFPTRFLEGEDIANNFLFNADRLLPLPIYD